MKILQPDGSTKLQDTRVLPFIRFEDNEAHAQRNGGLNLRGMNRPGPKFSFPDLNEELVKEAVEAHPYYKFPFYIHNFRCWEAEWAFHAGTSGVLIDGLDVYRSRYGVWRSVIDRHTYVNTSYQEMGHRDMHVPFSLPIPKEPTGEYEKDYFRGIAKFYDEMPPVTVITHVLPQNGHLHIRGTTSDTSNINSVKVNGQPAISTRGSFTEWEITLKVAAGKGGEVAAFAEDMLGNVEPTPHRVQLMLTP